MKGKFIIFEGTDGSGKTTQFNLAKKYFEAKGFEVKTLDFPQYDQFWGNLIGRFLSGEFGGLEDVSPYMLSPIYLLDQTSMNKQISDWLEQGYLVMSNRYVTSSMAHQTAKFKSKEERQRFLDWYIKAAYEELKAIKEDITIVLYAKPQITLLNAQVDQKRKSGYSNGKVDIAEESFEHQVSSSEMYIELANTQSTWELVDCMVGEELDSVGNIHKKVAKLIEEKLSI